MKGYCTISGCMQPSKTTGPDKREYCLRCFRAFDRGRLFYASLVSEGVRYFTERLTEKKMGEQKRTAVAISDAIGKLREELTRKEKPCQT